MREGDATGWDTLNLLFLRKFQPGVRETAPGTALITAVARGDTAARDRKLAEMRRRGLAGPFPPREAMRALAAVREAERIARVLLDTAPTPGLRGDLRLVLAEAALAGGRWRAARAEIDVARKDVPVRALLLHAAAVTMPMAVVPRAELERTGAEVAAWQPDSAGRRLMPSPALKLTPHVRQYLLGLIRSALGEPSAALAAADSVEAMAVDSLYLPVRDALARTVRADVAWRRGRPDDVLRLLAPLRGVVPLDVVSGGNVTRLSDHVLSQEHARLLRAMAQRDLGRGEDALPALTGSFVLTPGEAIYRAPASLEIARIHRASGRGAEAARYYREALAVWEGADPEMRPLVEEARAALRALGEP